MSGTLGFNRASCVKTLSENLRMCRILASRWPAPRFAANNAGPGDDRSVRNHNRERSGAQVSRRKSWCLGLLVTLTWCFPAAVLGQASSAAALISPAPGSVLGSSAAFTWTAGTGATLYELTLGTTIGAYDVYNSGHITGTSVTATGLPSGGETIYATLYSYIGGVWQQTSYTFTEQ